MASRQNGELHEHEDELLGELESELAGGHHEGLHEDELEAGLHEDEFGFHEAPHHEAAHHETAHHESHELGLHEFGMHEHGMHEGEQFFGKLKKIARGVGRFVKSAAPLLGKIAKIAAPMVAGAVGGPFGAILGRVATQALGEDELEGELGAHETLHEDELGLHEDEFEGGHHEGEFGHHEALPELGLHEQHETGHHEAAHEALAEVLAEAAAMAQNEAEAEAMAGAAAVTLLSASDRAVLRRLLPHLIRGVAVLTRVLRRQRLSRPALRAVPSIFRQTVRVIRSRAAAGRPVSRRTAGQVMAAVTRRTLSSPRVCGAAIVRNLRTTMRANRGGGPVAG